MRKYLSNNHEVAHYWGNQIQSEGQCGNIFFEGTTIYSYGHHFPIARLYPEKQICLFTIASYSVTTSAHKSLAYGAIPHNYITIEVPNLNVENTKGSSMLANIDYQFKNLSDLLFKASRARQRKNYLLHDFQNKFDKLKTYLTVFKVKSLLTSNQKMLFTSFENETNEDLMSTIGKKIAEAEKAKAKKIRAENKSKIEDWKNGNANYCPAGIGKIYLRINDNFIETSRNAKVSIDRAKVLFNIINKGKSIHGFKIDGYTVLNYVNDILTIGCHKIERKEIDRIATQLGLL